MSVRIRATGADGRRLDWIENLVRRPGGWFVLLGRAPANGAKHPSSSTAR